MLFKDFIAKSLAPRADTIEYLVVFRPAKKDGRRPKPFRLYKMFTQPEYKDWLEKPIFTLYRCKDCFIVSFDEGKEEIAIEPLEDQDSVLASFSLDYLQALVRLGWFNYLKGQVRIIGDIELASIPEDKNQQEYPDDVQDFG
jgi:hypothetical protein